MHTNYIRALVASAILLALTGLLPGCVVSTGALFDSNNGVNPLPVGHYQKQEYIVGNWVNKENGRLMINRAEYVWFDNPDDEDTKEGSKFTLHKIDNNLFVAMMETPKGKHDHAYELLQLSDDGVLEYSFRCDSARRLPGMASLGIKQDGEECIVASAADLTNLLRAYAKRSFPAFRYIREAY